MRLAAQVKSGYYPCAPEAVSDLMRHVAPKDGTRTFILDPCCGKGLALARVHHEVNIRQPMPATNVHGIELDGRRSVEAAATLAHGRVLADTDFLDAMISPKSFGLAWVNPSFDDEIGGGVRVESRFIQRATDVLAIGGILMAIMPQRIAMDKTGLVEFVLCNYDPVFLLALPEEYRPFNEVCILGVKREKAMHHYHDSVRDRYWSWGFTPEPESPLVIPPTNGPKVFKKGGPTIFEVSSLMQRSPLQAMFTPAVSDVKCRPPLELGQGQRALALAGGFLNETLQKPGHSPLVLKATPYKQQEIKDVQESETADGGTKTVTTLTERIGLRVRYITSDGTITTLED